MNALVATHDHVFSRVEAAGNVLMPTLARLVFAGVLLAYFWASALTKVGSGIFGIFRPSDGTYIQIFPRVVEAAGYDFSQLGLFHWAVALAGMWAEFLLPALIVLGLFTRLAALGMIAFIAVMTWVDIVGHGIGAADIGRWFDRNPSSLIVDQRALWVMLLLILVFRGAGPLSVDRLLARRSGAGQMAVQGA